MPGIKNISFISRFAIVAILLLTTLNISMVSAASSDSASAQSYETRFLKMMINHHTMAVEMGKTCQSKATHTELQTLCGNIVSTQNGEIQKMQTWLSDWYGVKDYQPVMMHDGKMQNMDMRNGAAYEQKFMQGMIMHHQKAVKEGGQCIKRATHNDLRDLCRTITISQSEEITQMRSWLCDWNKVCLKRKK